MARPRDSGAVTIALAIIRIGVGVHIVLFGFDRIAWVLDATPIATQLSTWLATAGPIARWYLERLIPGVPLYARLVPLASMAAGVALAFGVWTRISAAVSLVTIVSLQFGSGTMFTFAYFADAEGPPLIGALVGLIIAGQVHRPQRPIPPPRS